MTARDAGLAAPHLDGTGAAGTPCQSCLSDAAHTRSMHA